MDNNIKIKRCGNEKTMELKDHNGLKYLVFPKIEELGMVDHLFTTRLGGVSKGCYAQCNLSYTRGDDKNDVDENYRLVADALGHGKILDDFVCTYQTHTTNIKVVTEEDRGKGPARLRDYTDIDGLITDVPGIILGSFHADCPPVYLIDPAKRAIGLVHSGWKGTKGKIAGRAVEMLGQNFGSSPQDLICAIGPSICGECYEISRDVAEEFQSSFTEKELSDYGILIPYPNDKFRLYLWNAIKLTLIQPRGQKKKKTVTDK